jgi:hypothetical protein
MRFVVSKFDSDKRIKGFFPEVNFPINGNFVVKVPSTVSVHIDPDMTLADLLARKDAGILAFYSSFAGIISEDFLNASGLDIPVSPDPTILFAGIGDESSSSFNPSSTYLLPGDGVNYGRITSKTVTPTTPLVNSDIVVIWELFELVNTEDTTGLVSQYYSELESDHITCEVSLDDGANWEPVFNNTFTSLTHSGSDVKVRFTNNLTYSARKVWFGYYAILHT